jgi:hypothetical protein
MKRFSEMPTLVRDGLLAVAFDVYRNEEHFWGYHALEEGRGERCWGPVDKSLFTIPIGLGNVTLKSVVTGPRSIEKATITVADEMITVTPETDPEIYEDEWAREMLEGFRESFYGHSHPLCFRAKREQIQAANLQVAQEIEKSLPLSTSGMSSQVF